MFNPILTLPAEKNWPAQGKWTYDDYLRLPDDGRRYEIIEGVLYISNAPSYDHQFAVLEIAVTLRQFVKTNNLGVVLIAPFEVHLSPTTRPVQPDVLFIQAAAQPQRGDKFFEGIPDLIVEVISPSSTRTDRRIKFDVYERAGVAEYWLVNPKTRSIEVHTLSGGEYALLEEFVEDEIVQSEVLAGLELVTSSIFNT